MAVMNFGGVEENVVTREEFPLEKAREVLKNETIAIIGYGVQGPGQSLNLRDNGFNVIVGQRKESKTWDKAVADGWVPGETLFDIEEACEKATIIQYLLSGRLKFGQLYRNILLRVRLFTSLMALQSLTKNVQELFLLLMLMLFLLLQKVQERVFVVCSCKVAA